MGNTRSIVLGQYLGIGVLVATSLICSLLVLTIPRQYVALLGLAPIVIGLVKLRMAWRSGTDYDDAEPRRTQTGGGEALNIAGVTVANGGDDLGIHIPMFATSTASDVTIIVGVFAVMTGLWCGVAHYLVHHPMLGSSIRCWGHRALPIALIALGVYVLWKLGSFRFFDNHL